jgi:hypothetical protein
LGAATIDGAGVTIAGRQSRTAAPIIETIARSRGRRDVVNR